MPQTYEPIATTTLSTAASDITFSTIPGTYTDLILVVNGYQTVDDNVFLQFNGDTGTNYSATILYGNGSTVTATRLSSSNEIRLGGIGNSDGGNAIYSIQNYSNNTTNKTVLGRTNFPSSLVQTRVGLWRSTSAITSIKVASLSGNFVSGCTFTIYGIKAA